MGLIVPLLLISSAIALAIAFLSWNYNYWKKRGVNGPRPVLIFGNFPRTGRGEAHMIYELDKYYQEFKSKEKFIGVFWARIPQLVLVCPKLIKDVLITNFKAFHDNDSSQWPIKGVDQMAVANPFMIAGETWKEKRSEVVSGLTSARLKLAYPIMKNAAQKLTTYLRDNIKVDSELEARNFCQKFTGEITADFLWGIDAGAFKTPSEDCPIIASAKKMLRQSFRSATFNGRTAIFPLLRFIKSERFFPKDTDNFFFNIQKDAIELRLKNPNNRADMLQHLIQLQDKKHLSTVDVTGHSLTVVLDGFESSGIILSQTLLFLSRNIEAQKKLRQEINEHVDESGQLSFEDLNDLPYLDQCVNESLRILPPVPIITKICTEPFEFEKSDGEKVKVEKGVLKSFIPERFDEDNGGVKKFKEMGYFMPFGDGPRICLGMKLALVEIKTGVVEVVRNFEFTSSKSTRLDNEVNDDTAYLLSYKGDILLNLKAI